MNQLVKKEEVQTDIVVKDVESMQNLCCQLMRSKHYQKMGEEGIFAIVQKARALNIDPLEALNGGMYYINGKVGMSSEMMSALIRSQGHSIMKDPKSDKGVCILNGKRADNGDTWTTSFSMEDAKRAGLMKNMYDRYPEIMLYNRAMSMIARQLFPDVIKGAGYTPGELMEIKAANTSRVPSPRPFTEEDKVITVTSQQAVELLDILSDCDAEYQHSVMAFIAKPPINATSLSQLPVVLFERVKTAALQKREENMQKKLAEEPLQQAVGE
jgi:hypothetical protein